MVSNNKCNNKIKYIGSNIISERNINLEIFRILSILLVITLHILGHGNFLESTELFSFNYYTLSLLQSLSFVAVNCFVLISGYFLVKSQFKFNKVLNLLSVIFFYSSILTFIVWKFNLVEVSLKDFIYSVLPITSNRYWFATSYVLLYLISPFLNSSINKMTRLELKKLIIALIILFSVIPTFTFYVDGFGVNNGYGLIWFICLYTVSSYLRLYYEPNHKKNKWIIYYFMICSILFLTKIFISKLSISIIGRLTGSMIFFKYNSILVFLASVFLFLYFLNLKISSKIIIRISLFLSPLSFGVYLVHDHYLFKEFLWSNFSRFYNLSNNYFLTLVIIILIFVIYLLSASIEKSRQIIFHKFKKTLYYKKIKKFGKNIAEKIRNIIGIYLLK